MVGTRHCDYCDARIDWIPKSGRPPKYCKRSHRQRMYEDNRRGVTAKEIIAEHGMRCYLCGEKLTPDTFSLDHVIPVSLGGADEPDNLRPCCRRCNSRKAARPLDQVVDTLFPWDWTTTTDD